MKIQKKITDNLTTEQRRKTMQAVKSSNSQLEQLLCRALWQERSVSGNGFSPCRVWRKSAGFGCLAVSSRLSLVCQDQATVCRLYGYEVNEATAQMRVKRTSEALPIAVIKAQISKSAVAHFNLKAVL